MKINEHEDHNNLLPMSIIADIDARIAKALRENPEVFDDAAHQAVCDAATEIGRNYFANYRKIYATARPATRRRPAHTEVKFEDYTRPRKSDLNHLHKLLEAAGVKEVTWSKTRNNVSFIVY